jgi:RNA polymerase-binding transcription factor DksA
LHELAFVDGAGCQWGSRSLAVVDPEHPSTPEASERPPDLTILAKVESELADVERALARLDEGTYGTCQACGAVIDDERLAAEPGTAFCHEHQPG